MKGKLRLGTICLVFILHVACAGRPTLVPSSGHVRSATLQNGFAVCIDSGQAQNLYTIAIFNPEGEYSGKSQGKFRIFGTGSVRETVRPAGKLTGKGVPSGTDDWEGVICCGYGSANTVQNASFWYADEANKIKFYVAESAKRGIYGNLDAEYWNDMKGYLSDGFLKDGMLGQERDSFGLVEYDKDGTEYFYVVVSDFGTGSMLQTEGIWSGVVGLYSQTHIRPGKYSDGTFYSNEADIFYINSRFIEGYSEVYKRDKEGYPAEFRKAAADIAASTLLHEYMHYLMDSNILLGAEKEFEDDIIPETGTIYDSYGSIPLDGDYGFVKDYTSELFGSVFWLEGTANYAPYRLIGESDYNAVKEWLGIMNRWRPAISATDGQSQAGSIYAVYGAAGLFFSYVAEKYGEEVENRFHSWRDKASDVVDAGGKKQASSYCGNICTMTKSVLSREFKDEYSDFLCQCLTSISDGSEIPGKSSAGFKCAADWGFTKENIDKAVDDCSFAVKNARAGYESDFIPELSFVINRWDQIPDKLVFEGEGFDCYAVWF